MKTVDETITSWSGKEKEQLRDLIEECRIREKKIFDNSERSRQVLVDINNKLEQAMLNLITRFFPWKGEIKC